MCYEFKLLEMEYQRQLDLDIHYKNVVFEKRFRADLVIENKIPIENKAVRKLTSQD